MPLFILDYYNSRVFIQSNILDYYRSKVLDYHTLMDILYHIADFQKNILIVLTAFPLELKSNQNLKSFIHSLSKLVWIKKGFFIWTSFDRLWMEIFPFLFLILKGFYKGFQMRYHLFFNSNGKAVKTIKMFFWKSAVCNQELVSVVVAPK